MARLLLLMVIPGSALFLVLIRYANAGHTTLSVMFFVAYLMVATTQVMATIMSTGRSERGFVRATFCRGVLNDAIQ